MFNTLTNALPNGERLMLDGFLVYFRRTWLTGLALTLWNKYGINNQHRTNNIVESWHSRLKAVLPTHPNIYIFVKALKTIHACTKITIDKASCGVSPPKGKAKYIRLEQRLEKAFMRHRTLSISTEVLLATVQHCVNTTKHY